MADNGEEAAQPEEVKEPEAAVPPAEGLLNEEDEPSAGTLLNTCLPFLYERKRVELDS